MKNKQQDWKANLAQQTGYKMPEITMIRRPESKKNKNPKDKNTANLSWLFYRDYYSGITSIRTEDQKEVDILKKEKELGKKEKDSILQFFNEKNEEIKLYSFDFMRNSQVIDNLKGNDSFKLSTTYPGLITGLGLPHSMRLSGEIKLGFQFDYSTGLPYIPGSSVKGLLRSMFPYSWKVKPKDEEKTEVKNYRTERKEYIIEIASKLENQEGENISLFLDEAIVKKIEYLIFEGKDENGKTIELYNRDVFFDALIVGCKDSKVIDFDFITPHDQPLKDPNPIQFLKILPNTVFQFSFKLNPVDKVISTEQKLALFKRILRDVGIGAKTNVGYGQFA